MGSKTRRSLLPTELVGGFWPMRGLIHEGEAYEVKESDGFQRPGLKAKRHGKGHLGHDFMSRRRRRGTENRPEYTKWYFCPTGRGEAVSPVRGIVGIVKFSKAQGWWVEVKHGRYMSVFRHLACVHVRPGDVVGAGDSIGIIGHAPKAGKRGINHLHWELWDMHRKGPRRRSVKIINAKRYLRHWKKLPARN